jgi:triosephosphate isomerase
MRKLFVAGNWKMNLNGRQAVELARALKARFGTLEDVRLAVCPPFVYLKAVADALAGSLIGVGAQNMYPEPEGAFTGEVAGPMLLDSGCRYVILGHSERRHVIGEKDEFINAKVLRALQVRLEPILCVGERLEQREADETEAVVAGQLRAGLSGVEPEQMGKVTIAYEPVWAIGTGRNATPQQAQQVHAMLRGLLADIYGAEVATRTVIQYGGSVKPENAAQLMGMDDVDGALVGGASLKADSFGGIVSAAASVRK